MNARENKLAADMVALVEKLWNQHHSVINLYGEKTDFIIVPVKGKIEKETDEK